MLNRVRIIVAALRGRPIVSGVTFVGEPGWAPGSLRGGIVHGCTFTAPE